MKKLNIYDVISQLQETMTPEKVTAIQLTLEADENLRELWFYLNYKRNVILEEYNLLDDRLKDPKLFWFNYYLISNLLEEKLFLNAYRSNLKETVYRFVQYIKDNKCNVANFDESYENILMLLNDLICKVNDNTNDVGELEAIKRLYAVEANTNKAAFIAFKSNNAEELKLRYQKMIDLECMVFTMYYLMEQEEIFYDKNVLKSVKPYLEKIKTLYENYKDYGVIDKLERIREIKK